MLQDDGHALARRVEGQHVQHVKVHDEAVPAAAAAATAAARERHRHRRRRPLQQPDVVGIGGVDQRQLVRGLCLVDGLGAALGAWIVDGMSQLVPSQS